MGNPERIRIVVADDHPSTRENLRYLLNAEPDVEVVGAARNGVEALRLILELRPDVAVLALAELLRTTVSRSGPRAGAREN